MSTTRTARGPADTAPIPVQPQSAGPAESPGSSPGLETMPEEARLVDHDAWQAMIAVAAYYQAERRGFAPGSELDDWLAAEVEIARQLRAHDERAT